MKKKRKIFVSAVSGELKHYRLAVEESLRSWDYETVHQEVFPQTAMKIRELLRKRVEGCDAMICLVGTRFGFSDREPVGDGTRYSYTQLEYVLALELQIPIYLFLTDLDNPPERYETVSESSGEVEGIKDESVEDQERQIKFRDWVIRDNDSRKFSDVNHLLYQLSTLKFPWQAVVAGRNAESSDAEYVANETRATLADAFGIIPDRLENELPKYAATYLKGDLDEAWKLALDAANELKQSATTSPTQIARAYWIAGFSANMETGSREAVRHLESSLRLLDAGQDPRLRARILNLIGYVRLTKGEYELARGVLVQAVHASESSFGPDHPATLSAQSNLASALTSLGEAAEAEPLVFHIREVRDRVLGAEHPRTLAARSTLANCHSMQGRYEETDQEYYELREVYSSVYGKDHASTLRQHYNLANNLVNQEDYDEAEKEYRALLMLCENVYGAEAPETASVLNELAWIYYSLEEYDRAKVYAVRAVKALSSRIRTHPEKMAAKHTLASILAALGDWEQAKKDFRSLIQVQAKVYGEAHIQTLTSRYDLAKMLKDKQVEHDEASRQVHEALKHARESLGIEHPITVKCDALAKHYSDTV